MFNHSIALRSCSSDLPPIQYTWYTTNTEGRKTKQVGQKNLILRHVCIRFQGTHAEESVCVWGGGEGR